MVVSLLRGRGSRVAEVVEVRVVHSCSGQKGQKVLVLVGWDTCSFFLGGGALALLHIN